MDAIDIYIKSTDKDFLSFIELQKDIKEYSRLNGNVYVSVHSKYYSKFKEIIDPDFILLKDEDILKESNYQGTYSDNYITQQFLKILAHKVVKNQAYLVLDSNTLLCKPIYPETFKHDGKFVYETENFSEDDAQWEIGSINFLGLKKKDFIGLSNVNQVLIKENVSKLCKFIKEKMKKPFADFIMDYSYHNPNRIKMKWTEFHVYGLFCAYFLEESNHIYISKNNVIWMNPGSPYSSITKDIVVFDPLMIKMHKERVHTTGGILSDKKYYKYVNKIRSMRKPFLRKLAYLRNRKAVEKYKLQFQ